MFLNFQLCRDEHGGPELPDCLSETTEVVPEFAVFPNTNKRVVTKFYVCPKTAKKVVPELLFCPDVATEADQELFIIATEVAYKLPISTELTEIILEFPVYYDVTMQVELKFFVCTNTTVEVVPELPVKHNMTAEIIYDLSVSPVMTEVNPRHPASPIMTMRYTFGHPAFLYMTLEAIANLCASCSSSTRSALGVC